MLVLRCKHNGWFVFLWQVSFFNIAMIMGGPARTRRLLVLLTHKGDKVVERLLRESLVGNM